MEGDVNLILESVEDKWNHIRARLHETRSELKPVWNLKPLWNGGG